MGRDRCRITSRHVECKFVTLYYSPRHYRGADPSKRLALSRPPRVLAFHLRGLVSAGLVAQEKNGRAVICRAQYDRMDAVIEYLREHCCEGLRVACRRRRPAGRVDHLRTVSPPSYAAGPDGGRLGFLRSDRCRSWHLAHFGLDRLCSRNARGDTAGACDWPLDRPAWAAPDGDHHRRWPHLGLRFYGDSSIRNDAARRLRTVTGRCDRWP